MGVGVGAGVGVGVSVGSGVAAGSGVEYRSGITVGTAGLAFTGESVLTAVAVGTPGVAVSILGRSFCRLEPAEMRLVMAFDDWSFPSDSAFLRSARSFRSEDARGSSASEQATGATDRMVMTSIRIIRRVRTLTGPWWRFMVLHSCF